MKLKMTLNSRLSTETAPETIVISNPAWTEKTARLMELRSSR